MPDITIFANLDIAARETMRRAVILKIAPAAHRKLAKIRPDRR
jgi:hypothetical protein